MLTLLAATALALDCAEIDRMQKAGLPVDVVVQTIIESGATFSPADAACGRERGFAPELLAVVERSIVVPPPPPPPPPTPDELYATVQSKRAELAGLLGGWEVRVEQSRLDDLPEVYAAVRSPDIAEGWLGKETRPLLVARCRKQRVSVFVVTGLAADLEEASLKYDRSTLTYRIGKNKAKSVFASQSNTSEVLFLPDPEGVLASLKGEEGFVVEFTPFRATPIVVGFPLSGVEAVSELVGLACGIAAPSE